MEAGEPAAPELRLVLRPRGRVLLSIIVPGPAPEYLRSLGSFELVCVEDGPSRGARLQAGVERAKGETLLLHHPRSAVEPEGLRWLAENEGSVAWGGFTHAFDWDHPVLRFASWYSNNVRAALRGIVYLDHCVFFRRRLLTRPIPPLEIFEDTELSLILRESGPAMILPYKSTTSAIRFRANGVWTQSLLNQRLKLAYLLGASNGGMNARYERGLKLNG